MVRLGKQQVARLAKLASAETGLQNRFINVARSVCKETDSARRAKSADLSYLTEHQMVRDAYAALPRVAVHVLIDITPIDVGSTSLFFPHATLSYRSVLPACAVSVQSSSAPNSRSNHALLDTLHALQIFQSFLVQHIHIQLFHDLDDDIERLEEAVHGNAQHAVRRSFVLSLQDRLLLVTHGIFARSIDEREGATDEWRELFIDCQRPESRFC